MFFYFRKDQKVFNAVKPSRIAFYMLLVSIFFTVALSILDRIIHRDLLHSSQIVTVWVLDFHYLFVQGTYTATLFWAAAKFIERQTVLSVGFHRLDAAVMSVTGPDETNTVWIGRRYGARLEAEAVVVAFEVRIQDAQSRSEGR